MHIKYLWMCDCGGKKNLRGVKWLPFILILVIAAGLWQLTPPSGLSAPAWHSAIIFVATIASIVAKVLPIGAVGIIGITVFCARLCCRRQNGQRRDYHGLERAEQFADLAYRRRLYDCPWVLSKPGWVGVSPYK
ncbi:putative cation transporter [Salmonella enterica subsp. enterica]|uniref:Putative cation transporter n=1 Tax=Salmonella enterica I TaxID=59201 RepID=A0A447TVC3_SALET|nr:putative cation transporter [Salmonella enterica subsp. enterica]